MKLYGNLHIHVWRKILSLAVIALAIWYYHMSYVVMLATVSVMLLFFALFDVIHHVTGDKNLAMRLFFSIYPKKPHEYKRLFSDASVFLFSTLIMVLVFSREIVIFSLVVFLCADLTSHVFGIAVHKKPLFWNMQKTWGGLLPGFIFAWVSGYIVIFYTPMGIQLAELTLLSATVAIFSTLNDYDNIAMPWGAALLLLVLQ